MSLEKKDPLLMPYRHIFQSRFVDVLSKERELVPEGETLVDFASGYLYFGLHKISAGWVFREWAPNAHEMYLVGDFNQWKVTPQYELKRLNHGIWEVVLPEEAISHGDLYRLWIVGDKEGVYRIPAWCRRVLQDPVYLHYNAQVWHPEIPYRWQNPDFTVGFSNPVIYEAHIGMSTQRMGVGTFTEFKDYILPRIKAAGYNTLQLMAIQEHPLYGSFGYQVSSFFAVSSRFGSCDELKALIDEAHGMGIAVIMDLVHSHSVKNEVEGIGLFDGTDNQYFYTDERRMHPAWDSLCFDYGKNEVLHFLLSNCKYWLEEFHFDGFRFDGVTSMIYTHHGLEKDFTSYEMYFDGQQNDEAIIYLSLANKLIHTLRPEAICIAEEMSGMPGICSPLQEGGMGFNFRMAMGIPDFWIKLIKEHADEKWDVGHIFYELTNKRVEEKTVSYAESHDQALVGDKTIIFRLMDKRMYTHMSKDKDSLVVERGMALHKMIRLITFATNGGGYLNFMGNEFGHPEWIDFPRPGNNWSFHYARRQWSLADDNKLRYHQLKDFDEAMMRLFNENRSFWIHKPNLIHMNQKDKVLVFQRGEWIFTFNFNPSRSFPDYSITIMPGKFQVVLDTDWNSFGGFNRVDASCIYYSSGGNGKVASMHQLKLYLPNRTALVLRKVPVKSVHQ